MPCKELRRTAAKTVPERVERRSGPPSGPLVGPLAVRGSGHQQGHGHPPNGGLWCRWLPARPRRGRERESQPLENTGKFKINQEKQLSRHTTGYLAYNR